jgi:flagellar M-ring protein FliF
MSQVTTQEEKYDPDGQVVRSTQTTDENAKENQPDTSGQVGASANVPGTPGASTTSTNASASGRTEETTNYEISKTTKTTIDTPGSIKKLSIAVAVDGITTPGAKGQPDAYAPRSADEMQHIDQLVRSAAGYDASRGDQISVINVRFDRDAAESGVAAGPKLLDFDKNDIMRGAELAVTALVAALIIFFVVRPLLTASSGGTGVAGMRALPAGAAGGAGGIGGMAQLTHDGYAGGDALALPGPGGAEVEQRIDIAKIEGQVRASSVKSVSEFVQKHPEESVSILRSWLHEA